MTNAKLITEPSSILAGRNGPATGELWLELGRSAFPMKHWNDFIVVVAGAFVRAALHLFGRHAHATVHFMDGPYAVELFADDVYTWLRGSSPWGRPKLSHERRRRHESDRSRLRLASSPPRSRC